MELSNTDSSVKSFEANGKTYYVESRLSIERFIAFQKLEVELAYGGGFLGVMKSLNKSIEHLNKTEWVNAAVELTNVRESIIKQDKTKRVPAVDICSLFINTKDEDRRIITDEMLEEKQKDFEAAGIPIDFFFQLAHSLVIGLKEHLKAKE